GPTPTRREFVRPCGFLGSAATRRLAHHPSTRPPYVHDTKRGAPLGARHGTERSESEMTKPTAATASTPVAHQVQRGRPRCGCCRCSPQWRRRLSESTLITKTVADACGATGSKYQRKRHAALASASMVRSHAIRGGPIFLGTST